MARVEIPYKFPSYNEYQNLNRKNPYAGASRKKQIEKDIAWFLNRLPEFKEPVWIHFHWIEGNHKRDLDNVSFAKKFILDALVKQGKLVNDNTKYVVGFMDTIEFMREWKVIVEIKEVEDGL